MPSTGISRALARTAASSSAERPSSRTVIARARAAVDRRRQGGEVDVAGLDQRVDHAGESELLTLLGGEDRDAPGAEQCDLLGHDDAATAAEDLHVPGADFGQPLLEVGEVLDVAALVGADRDALHVLLHRRLHDGLDAAVVAEVDDLRTLALQHAAHDVDGRVVTVEQARGRHEADGVLRDVQSHRVLQTALSGPHKVRGHPRCWPVTGTRTSN
jgi:hypothetical protein